VRLSAFTRNYHGATVYAVTLAADYDENRYIPDWPLSRFNTENECCPKSSQRTHSNVINPENGAADFNQLN